ncbi:unnamed protein product [Ceutorhynchus assimilis]|uniref:Poly [ADP-ribose] polymerase n=1 Tax=Ceutorhynchus assimilis TaxID=467358 RepID=A0A9N9QI13_9CUCU|nr:unnamed protein product [Ceutorhynchus assimilis]
MMDSNAKASLPTIGPENSNHQASSQSCTLGMRKSKSSLEENDDDEDVKKLKSFISKNFAGCDLTLCIFMAAAKTFKIDQCLRPFPQCFVDDNNEKDFVRLKKTCDKIPPLKDFLTLPSKNISKDIRNLLSYLFMESGIPVFSDCSVENLPLSVVNKQASISALPQYVFEVNYNSKFEEAFKKRKGSREIIYAFHGSSVHNFYSILKFGLQQHFRQSKEVLFGNGIYLSNEISVCTNYSPFGETWENSSLGQKHSIIALCEIINNEEEVKCKDEKNKKRALNQDSYGAIPDKYFVVTNSELVKIKYLLAYRYRASTVVASFTKKNCLWIVIVLYLAILVLIRLVNGPSWPKFIRYLCSFIE